MPIVVLAGPHASRAGIARVAAASVLALLHESARFPEDSAERAALTAWEAGLYRKLVRRAKSLRDLERACASGYHSLVRVQGSSAACFLPSLPPLSRALSRLQLSSWGELFDVDEQASASGEFACVLLNPHVDLSPGKAAAQVSHAAHLLWRSLGQDARAEWASSGLGVAVDVPTAARWEAALEAAAITVVDAGLTEVQPGTLTCVGLRSLS